MVTACLPRLHLCGVLHVLNDHPKSQTPTKEQETEIFLLFSPNIFTEIWPNLNLNRIPKYLLEPCPTRRLLARSSSLKPPPHTLEFEANPYEWTPNIVLFSTTVNLCRTTRGSQTAICPHYVLKDSER